MIEFITIGGKEYPVSFTNYTQILYQRAFGRAMAADTQKLAIAIDAISKGDLSVPFVEELTNIAWVGLQNGHQKKGLTFDLTYDTLADLLLGDSQAIEKVTVAYLESLPKPETDSDEKKTRPEPTPAKVAGE